MKLRNTNINKIKNRGKWGKVSHLFSWLRGGETMNIEEKK